MHYYGKQDVRDDTKGVFTLENNELTYTRVYASDAVQADPNNPTYTTPYLEIFGDSLPETTTFSVVDVNTLEISSDYFDHRGTWLTRIEGQVVIPPIESAPEGLITDCFSLYLDGNYNAAAKLVSSELSIDFSAMFFGGIKTGDLDYCEQVVPHGKKPTPGTATVYCRFVNVEFAVGSADYVPNDRLSSKELFFTIKEIKGQNKITAVNTSP